jgi:hypothetical protein
MAMNEIGAILRPRVRIDVVIASIIQSIAATRGDQGKAFIGTE